MSGEVEGVRSGDAAVVRSSVDHPDNFELIFRRHHQRIWTYLARLGGRERADDLTAEVFLAAFAQRDRYDAERGLVQSWLYGIASNVMRTHFRSDTRAVRALARVASVRMVAGSPGLEVVEDALASRDELERVRDAMEQLSVADREVIVLFAWEQLPYDTIATVLGVAVGTVRSRLARARRRLRELAGLSGELSDAGEVFRKKVADE